jgi:hypothetical protein
MTDQAVSTDVGAATATAADLISDEAASAREAPASGGPGDWTAGLDDEGARAFAQAKGWKSPADMLGSYRNLEKLVGSEKLPLPKDEGDRDGYDRIFKALGRPDGPDGYDLGVAEGADPAFAGEAAKWLHEAGLSTRQASALAERWNGYSAQAMAAHQKAQEISNAQEFGELRSEWGQRFDANLELGRRAARQFGLERGDLAGLENALGAKRMLTMLNRIGAGMAEDSFEGGGARGTSFRMSPQAARDRISLLKSDQAWSSRFLAAGADETAEWNRLQRLANPEG